jgi:hypothetical protein
VVRGVLSQSVARSLTVALLGVLVACSGGSGGDGRKSSRPTAAPTTSPPATIDLSKPIPGGSLHGTPRPPLENTGTDYVAIFKSLDANFRWLTENPNPGLIAELFVPGTQGHDSRVPVYQYLVDNGYRWADEAYQLLAVDVASTTPNVVSLSVRDSLEFERIVDAAGNQVGNVRPRSPREKTSTALLSLGTDGHWRIADWSTATGGEVQL